MTRALPRTALAVLLLHAACSDGGESSARTSQPLEVGDARDVELQYLRFDVTNFEKRLTRDDLLRLPRDVRERLWLVDLDLSNGPNTPRLLDNALAAIREIDPGMLGPAERNMQALLRMTPDTANLKGSALESLIDLAPLLGVAPEQVLADLFQMNVEDPFLSDAAITEAILKQVIGTHPNAQTRLGARTSENPEGVYPVAPGSLPINLTDLATNFASFGRRFGAYSGAGREHPGFVGETVASVLTDRFAIAVRANANALPYKGLDLTVAQSASISSIRSQIDGLFDFQDPGWMRVEGLVEGEPRIDRLTFRIVEAPSFVPGGLSPTPAGIGASPAWALAPWTIERVLIGAAQGAFRGLTSTVAYTPRGKSEPLFRAQVVDGFQTIAVQGGIGAPPAPSYVWDLLLEVAQVRLHDGGLREGEGSVAFTLRDVPVGFTTAEIEARVKQNLEAAPSSLLALTETVLASTEGAADFYYYRVGDDHADDERGDWLYFVAPGDLARDEEGQPVRGYGYAQTGFYADADLREKVSSPRPLDGDTEHEKVRLDDHPELFVADDDGAVYRLSRRDKPSPSRIALRVERVR